MDYTGIILREIIPNQNWNRRELAFKAIKYIEIGWNHWLRSIFLKFRN